MTPTALEQLLDYTFSDRSLFELALTHRSFSEDHNERLELLGDSILSGSVTALLYKRFPRLSEGGLSRIRSNLVRESTLHEIAVALNLSSWLRLSDAEISAGGLVRPSILADAFEAVLGGVFLDGGFPPAERLVRRIYTPVLDTIDIRHFGKDPKTRLQELLQAKRVPVPTYRIVAIFDDEQPRRYESECVITSRGLRTTGIGPNRRVAEREAAHRMLSILETRTAA
ncbi:MULTISPECIES: ribonuclease III [Pandoraea]|uniref:Ribonuclease 3 n=2 Tax=Pandoraea TaxID=93217 RepID=A0A5E4XE84_9BURK|nr:MULTISPECIES: ribonuclease III [Pandoraea]VVE16776.1 Ribonuclease 3 [Pandoraea cepalis]VVE34596.1 Ribonuclease 3 [Pandoraea terrigena]